MDNIMLEIFEEIKTKQTEHSKQLTEQSRQLTKLSEQQETLSSILATQSAPTVAEPLTPLEPQILRHVHRLELKTSRWLMITVGLSAFLIGSTMLNYSQHKAIKQIETNDVKYRYVKMKGDITAGDLLRLDTIPQKELTRLRNDVETYERLIQEQAEIFARTHTLQQQTNQLKER